MATKQKTTNNNNDSNLRMEYAKAVTRLKEVNVNFLAIDFDKTLVDVHTGGRWRGTVDELATHVREEFRVLFYEAMRQGIRIAMVTFSPQQDLIRGVLESFVHQPYPPPQRPLSHNGDDNNNDNNEQTQPRSTTGTTPRPPLPSPSPPPKIPIRCGDLSWEYKGDGSREGKQAHMASAVEELEQEAQQHQPPGAHIEIAKSTTLLIDDDIRNIKIALEDGVRAIWFNPNRPKDLVRDLQRLV